MSVLETLHVARSKLNEMRQKQEKNVKKVEIARLRMEVKEKIDDLAIQLDRMDKIIKSNERN